MIFGAAAFLIYASVISSALFRKTYSVLTTTAAALIVWIALAFGTRLLI